MFTIAINATAAEAAAMVCPAALGSGAKSEFKLVGTLPASTAQFDTLSVVEGEPGDETKYAPVALVPEINRNARHERIDFWNLALRDRPLLMICSYHGTSTYLRAVIPEGIKACELTVDRHPRQGQCK